MGEPPREDGQSVPSKKRFVIGRGLRALSFLVYILSFAGILVFAAAITISGSESAGYFVNNLVSAYIADRIGMDVTIGNIDIDIIGEPGVTLTSVSVFYDGKSGAAIRQIRVVADMDDLLRGNFGMLRLTLTSPVAKLERRRDGTLSLPKLFDGGTSGSSSDVLGYLGLFREIRVTGGAIRWTDQNISHEKPFNARAEKIWARYHGSIGSGGGWFSTGGIIDNAGRKSTFHTDGALLTAGAGAPPKYSAHVRLKDVGMADYRPYIAKYSSVENVMGNLSANVNVTGDFNGAFKSGGTIRVAAASLAWAKVFSYQPEPQDATLEYDVAGDYDSVDIDNAFLRFGEATLDVSGSVTGIESGDPDINMEISGNDIDLNYIKRYFPDKIAPEQHREFFMDIARAGSVRLSRLSYEGSLSSLERFGTPESMKSFSGSIHVSGLNLVFRNLHREFRDVEGDISLANNSLRLAAVKGKYGKSELMNITGSVGDLFGVPSYKVAINANLDLDEALQLFKAKASAGEIKSAIENVEWMKGAVYLNLNVAGITGKNGAVTAVGRAGIFDGAMKIAGTDTPVTEMEGEMDIDLKDTWIRKIAFNFGASRFTASAYIKDIYKKSPVFDVKVTGDIAPADTDAIAMFRGKNIFGDSGVIHAETSIKGGLDSASFETMVDFTQSELNIEPVIEKQNGARNVYSASGSYSRDSGFSMNSLTVDIGSSRAEITGDIGGYINTGDLNLNIKTDGILLDDLDRFFVFFDDIKSRGAVSGDVTITGGTNGKPIQLKGFVYTEDADFRLSLFNEAFHGCYARVELANDKIFLKSGHGGIGKGYFAITGYGALTGRPEFTLNVDAAQLHLYDLFGGTSSEESAPAEAYSDESIEPDWIWRVLVNSKAGTIGPLTYQNLHTSVLYKDQKIHIDPFTFSAHGGKWSWVADMGWPEGGGISFDSRINAREVDMGKFLSESLEKEQYITGLANISGTMAGEGATAYEIKRSLRGRLDFGAGRGVIRKFNMLGKIFSLLNVTQYFKLRLPDLSVDGMPFNSVSGVFRVEDGIARTDNLLVDSESMRILAIGDYDIGASMVDMEVGVMPFVAVDRVISSIPLAGHILTGDKRGLLATFFKVKGPLANPDTTITPIESLASGVVGILKRIFEAPKKALESLDDFSRRNGASR